MHLPQPAFFCVSFLFLCSTGRGNGGGAETPGGQSAAGLGAPPTAPAEGESTLQEQEGQVLPEMIITSTMDPRKPMDSPFADTVLRSEDLKRRSYRSTPQALRDIPGILVQETAVGHGSPYIRGFTSFRNLFLVDGIRLNNSVFRPGPNQYWNTVDGNTIAELEVVKGPGSVLHGSDAIGGTVNALTKSAFDMAPGRPLAGALSYRYSSAEASHTSRAEGKLQHGSQLAVLMGVTSKDVGNLRAGGDTGEQPNTGYDELDGDLKMEGYFDESHRWVFGVQSVEQYDVPRTHKTDAAIPYHGTSVGSDRRRDLDQTRRLAYGQLHGEGLDGFFDRYSVSLSWHNQEELRNRTRSNGNTEQQGFEVGQVGLFANFSSDSGLGRLTYGFDLYHDEVDSFSSREPIQGPVADDASYDLFGLFVQDEIALRSDLDLILGARYNYAAADADSVLDPVSDTQTVVNNHWDAVVGSARFLWRVSEDRVHLFGGVSQGFRAPNLSDLTRLDSARTNEFEIPSPDLEPEHYTSYEIGVKTQHDRVSTQLALFYTDIRDQIVLFPTGNTNGSGEFEITKDNVGDGYVTGVELGAAFDLDEEWTLFGNGTYQYGEVDTYPSSAQVKTRETISRLMPFMAQAGLRWEAPSKSTWFEGQVVYADDADKLNSRDESDTSRIPPGGTPGYVIANLRGGWDWSDSLSLNVALENLGDVDYRVHGSGSNMPGVNLILGLRVSF